MSRSRPTPLSGFPEWLPAQRIVETYVLDTLRDTFERHGFSGIETRAVEPMSQLVRKGEGDIAKEIYLLHRWQSPDEPQAADAERTRRDSGDQDLADSDQLGLHFDLTVPFARYVLEHAGHLEFPFRRYQIQKVWRGERPQEGRFREFTQADIDVIDRGSLAFHHEVELPLVMGEALSRLPIPPIRIQANNRKLAEGFYRGLGLGERRGAPADAGNSGTTPVDAGNSGTTAADGTDTAAGDDTGTTAADGTDTTAITSGQDSTIDAVLRAVDKLDKIGPQGVFDELTRPGGPGLTRAQADACLALAAIHTPDASFVDRVQALGVSDPLLDEGLDELVRVVETAAEYLPGLLVADLRIARGLDYYTGTVYETQLVGHEDLGSICSGGRYDALASDGRVTYPGVGLSVGVTRLVSRLLGRDLVRATRSVPTCVVVVVPDEQRRPDSRRVAATLRARGIPAEVSPSSDKYGKQIRYADRRGIPYVWFPAGAVEGAGDQVRDIRSGEQHPADPSTWAPPAEDLHPRVVATPDVLPVVPR